MQNIPKPTKLKSTGVKELRLKLLEEQGFICGICGNPCSEEEAVLDHTHVHGYIRAVLHRTCNAVEGKVVNAMRRFGVKDPYAFLTGLVKYHEKHATDQTGIIHPSHFTPEEKIERAKARAKRKRLKADKLALKK
jgi:hypothetical protein